MIYTAVAVQRDQTESGDEMPGGSTVVPEYLIWVSQGHGLFLTTPFTFSLEHRNPKTLPDSSQPFYKLPSYSAPTSNWAHLVLSDLPLTCSLRTQIQGTSKQDKRAAQMP